MRLFSVEERALLISNKLVANAVSSHFIRSNSSDQLEYLIAGLKGPLRFLSYSLARRTFNVDSNLLENVVNLKASPDGRFIAAGTRPKSDQDTRSIRAGAYLYRLSGDVLDPFVKVGYTMGTREIDFSSVGSYFASTSENRETHIVDLRSGEIREVGQDKKEGSQNVGITVFSPDESHFLTVRSQVLSVYSIDKPNEAKYSRIFSSWIASASFSTSGRFIVIGAADNHARILDARTGVDLAHYKASQWVWNATMSPDEVYLANINWDNEVVIQTFVQNAEGNAGHLENYDKLRLPTSGRGLVFDKQSKYLGVTQWQGRNFLYDLQRKSVLELSCLPSNTSTAISFSDDGKFALMGQENWAMVYSTQDGRPVQSIRHRDIVNSVILVGTLVISASADGEVKMTSLNERRKVNCVEELR